MTRMQMTQAVAEDYADAMLVARRAKNVLFSFLALVLLIQLGVFFVARYVPGVRIPGTAPAADAADSASNAAAPTLAPDAAQPATGGSPQHVGATPPRAISPATAPTTAPAAEPAKDLVLPFDYVIPVTSFLGIILSIVLAVVLVLIITIMLVGRLIGVSHVTGAFCWSIVLIVMLFPWQALVDNKQQAAPTSTTQVKDAPSGEAPDMRIPGALYTYSELARDYRFSNASVRVSWLKWARFVGYPVFALFILLMVHGRSGRGLRFALGEAEVVLENRGARPETRN